MRIIGCLAIVFCLITGCKNNAVDHKTIKSEKVEQDIDEDKLVHSVYFKLKEELSATQEEEFIDILASFSEIESTESVEVGLIAETDDPRMGDFDVVLTVVFFSVENLKKYADDPLHLKGKKEVGSYLEGVPVVYDSWTLN